MALFSYFKSDGLAEGGEIGRLDFKPVLSGQEPRNLKETRIVGRRAAHVTPGL